MFQITGNTYPHRAMLKAAGLQWNAVSKAWETPNFEVAQKVVLRGAGLRLNGAAPLGLNEPPRQRRPRPEPPEDIRIEFPSRGATYCHQEYGVYKYGTYPRSSVLAGQQSRRFLGSFETLEEARAAYPTARETGCGYQRPYLGHLPDDGDPDPVEYDY